MVSHGAITNELVYPRSFQANVTSPNMEQPNPDDKNEIKIISIPRQKSLRWSEGLSPPSATSITAKNSDDIEMPISEQPRTAGSRPSLAENSRRSSLINLFSSDSIPTQVVERPSLNRKERLRRSSVATTADPTEHEEEPASRRTSDGCEPADDANDPDLRTSRFGGLVHSGYSVIFGNDYDSKESSYVLIAGALISFNSGFVNGSCLSGLLFSEAKSQSIAGFTSSYTKSALSTVQADWSGLGFNSSLILSYICGAFISGLITPRPTAYQIEPSYGPTFLIGGVFLLTASILAALDMNSSYVFYLAAAANGIQNGIASLYSANLIRCSLTGSTTDIALTLAQLLRGNQKNLWKGIVLSLIVSSFWIGGLVSFHMTRRFTSYTLLFNAGIFWAVGGGLIYFLVNEIGISVQAAVLGTWKWKRAMEEMVSSRPSLQRGDTLASLGAMFDDIDEDKNGAVDAEELFAAFSERNMKFSRTEVEMLVRFADKDNDGSIDRDEWEGIVEMLFKKK